MGTAGGGAGWSASKEIDRLMIPDRVLWCAGFSSGDMVYFEEKSCTSEKNLVHVQDFS